jgi:predicted dienelactone hydrolase
VIALSSSPALEVPAHPVGRHTVQLVDAARDARSLAVDIWYPAVLADEPPARYEVLPSVAFDAAVARDRPAVAGGRYPLILLSHGRTGMRFAYSLLCEALAARGNIVVSADHPGDALTDWLTGTFVDDRTNETGRVGDARFLMDTLLTADRSASVVPHELLDAIDTERVAAIGHSYGAYTALATAAGVRGVHDTRHDRRGSPLVARRRRSGVADGPRIRVPSRVQRHGPLPGAGRPDPRSPADGHGVRGDDDAGHDRSAHPPVA